MLDASSSSGFTAEDFQFFRKSLTSPLDRAFTSAAHTVADLVSDRDVRDLKRLHAARARPRHGGSPTAGGRSKVQLERDEALEERAA